MLCWEGIQNYPGCEMCLFTSFQTSFLFFLTVYVQQVTRSTATFASANRSFCGTGTSFDMPEQKDTECMRTHRSPSIVSRSIPSSLLFYCTNTIVLRYQRLLVEENGGSRSDFVCASRSCGAIAGLHQSAMVVAQSWRHRLHCARVPSQSGNLCCLLLFVYCSFLCTREAPTDLSWSTIFITPSHL